MFRSILIIFIAMAGILPSLLKGQNLNSFPLDSAANCDSAQAFRCWKSVNEAAPVNAHPLSRQQTENYYISQWGQSKGRKINFLNYLPPDYATSVNKNYPLIIYLHGNEAKSPEKENCLCFSRFSALTKAINEGPAAAFSNPNNSEHGMHPDFYNYGFIVIAPNRPVDLYPQGFTHDLIDEFIQMAKTNYRIDTNRIYLMGVSLGGGDALSYVSTHPMYAKKIAAVVTFSANGGNPSLKCNTVAENNIGVWAFQINSVGEENSEKIVKAINDCPKGRKALLTKKDPDNSSALYRCNDTITYPDGKVGCHNIPAHQWIIRGGTIPDTNINIYQWLYQFSKDTSGKVLGLNNLIASTSTPILVDQSNTDIGIITDYKGMMEVDLYSHNRLVFANKVFSGEKIKTVNYSEGIYLLRVEFENEVFYKKIYLHK